MSIKQCRPDQIPLHGALIGIGLTNAVGVGCFGRLLPVKTPGLLVKSIANAWADRVQVTGQWYCTRRSGGSEFASNYSLSFVMLGSIYQWRRSGVAKGQSGNSHCACRGVTTTRQQDDQRCDKWAIKVTSLSLPVFVRAFVRVPEKQRARMSASPCFVWCRHQESNPGPTDYKSDSFTPTVQIA